MVKQEHGQISVFSAHFGRLSVDRRQVIHFNVCLPPFNDVHDWVIIGTRADAPFLWLQALSQPALALVVASWECVTDTPCPAPPRPVLQELLLTGGEVPEVYVVVTIGERPQDTTINLLAPLFIARRSRLGRQVVLDVDTAAARTPLPLYGQAA